MIISQAVSQAFGGVCVLCFCDCKVALSLYNRICGCPIWDLRSEPARYDAEFRGRFLGPRDFSLPLAGVTAHARPAQGPPPRASKRWELNTVLIVNHNNRTTVGLANSRPTLGSQSPTLGRLGCRALSFPLNLMRKPTQNRLESSRNPKKSQKTRLGG